MEWACSKCGLQDRTREELDPSCKPPPTPAVPAPSAASNPPSSTRPGVFQTPDTFSALPPQNKPPCAPLPSDSSPPFGQSRSRSLRPHNSACPKPPAASLPAPDRPPSSADPDVPAPALNSGCAHPL